MGIEGICSNLISETQIKKIKRIANQLSDGKVRLMFDCDAEGDEGAKDAAWKLLQAGLDVRPLWSRSMHGGQFVDKQPETVTASDLDVILSER